ncbi:hypothetical protein [Pseudomonas oryzihabitans]|nr:hypothetical protein [Pseudomonas oryzihabitans]
MTRQLVRIIWIAQCKTIAILSNEMRQFKSDRFSAPAAATAAA